MRLLKRAVLPFLLVASLAACTGDAGPTGPSGPQGPPGATGPQGPTGPAGQGTRLVFSGTINSNGVGLAELPAAAGTLANPPALTCYIGETPDGPFLNVATDTNSGIACGIGRLASGNLAAIIIDAPVGWAFRFVVVF